MRQHRPRLMRPFCRSGSSLRLTAGMINSPRIPSRVEFSSKVCNVIYNEFDGRFGPLRRTPLTRSNIPMHKDKQRRSISSARARSSAVISLSGLGSPRPCGRTTRTVAGVLLNSLSPSLTWGYRWHVYVESQSDWAKTEDIPRLPPARLSHAVRAPLRQRRG